MPAFVVVVVATYRRAPEIARLLETLEKIPSGLGVVMVADNANDPATAEACRHCTIDVRYLPQPVNLGCGGGLRVAEESALAIYGARATHFWILDDDAVLPPESLGQLLAAMERRHADAAAPMLLNEAGRVGWFSGLLEPAKFRAIRRARFPADYLAAAGPDPVDFSWSTGICLLITRRALEAVGLHRADFWIRGEDQEYSLRITAHFRGIFVPTVEVLHLPPTAAGNPGAFQTEYRKQYAHVQNMTYTGLHLPHGRRIRGKIPGHYYRFLQSARWSPRSWIDALRAFWLGAVRRQPAGVSERLR